MNKNIIIQSSNENITFSDIVDSFKEAGLRSGDTLFIHSCLFSLGIPKGILSKEELANFFIEAILSIIGQEGTLIVPTFTLSFCKTGIFNSKDTKSEVGLLSEVFRKRDGVIRTNHPIYSVAVLGKDKTYYSGVTSSTCFGQGSIFDLIHRKGGVKIVLLGLSIPSSSQFHYIEELAKVPYRYIKKFKGIANDKPISTDFYVRDLVANAEIDHSKFAPFFEKESLMKRVKVGDGMIIIIDEKKMHHSVFKKLMDNPDYFLKEPYLVKIKNEQNKVDRLISDLDSPAAHGKVMYDLMKRLYPICRSITGEGTKKTLEIINEQIPLKILKIATGEKVYDWEIPKEWNVRDAYIKNSNGEKIVDFKKSNLHLLGYSTPINRKMQLSELKEHLFTMPEYPKWIPFRTSYYKENWGFCLSHDKFLELNEDVYEVFIDSTLIEGYLHYGEIYLKGRIKKEIIFSCYICHPSMCNDNLSGIVLLTELAKMLSNLELEYSYRFIFVPETIGAIAWLKTNESLIKRIEGGIVATCVGDKGTLTYKKTRRGDTKIDKVVEKVLIDYADKYAILDFFPFGSDERQFCSPGLNLPIGSLMRTPYRQFPEYHTSADNLDFVTAENLQDSLEKYFKMVYFIENDKKYLNTNLKCEPQLGKREIYKEIGGTKREDYEIALFWVLNLSDGNHSLLDIAKKANILFENIKKAADILLQKGLLITVTEEI